MAPFSTNKTLYRKTWAKSKGGWRKCHSGPVFVLEILAAGDVTTFVTKSGLEANDDEALMIKALFPFYNWLFCPWYR